MRRHDVKPLRAVFANLVHDTAATRADQAVRFDNLFDARQCGREIADGPLWRVLGCRLVICLGGKMFLLHLDLGQCDGQILKRQLPFILGQLFRPLPMQGMVQLGNQMLLALGNILKCCDRFHQGRNHCTLRGRKQRRTTAVVMIGEDVPAGEVRVSQTSLDNIRLAEGDDVILAPEMELVEAEHRGSKTQRKQRLQRRQRHRRRLQRE